jgi:hypothetical protein
VHSLTIGWKEPKVGRTALPREVWTSMNPIKNHVFHSPKANLTHEHFLKIVPTSFVYYHHDAVKFYKFLHFSSPFHASETTLPTVKMHFDFAPIHVVVREQAKPFYRFMTNLFAILGGTFTFFGVLDAMTDRAHQVLRRKGEIGKLQ